MPFSLEPNPLESGATALLSVRADGIRGSDAVSQGAKWDCWNGVRWMETHQIVRNVGGTSEPNPVKPGAITTVVAMWLPITSDYEITIPDVAAGTYRISDQTRDGLMGFVYVVVFEP